MACTTRAHPGLWARKLACIENCRKLGMKVCLVPTIIRGVTDAQVAPILQFALDNIDVVSAISYQPVCFTGRMDPAELAEQRYTLGDLAHDLADAYGSEPLRDMFPLSIVVPLGEAPDEPAHFRYVRYVARDWNLPVMQPRYADNETVEAFQPPAYYGLAALLAAGGVEDETQLLANPAFTFGSPFPAFLPHPEHGFPWQGAYLAWHVIRTA